MSAKGTVSVESSSTTRCIQSRCSRRSRPASARPATSRSPDRGRGALPRRRHRRFDQVQSDARRPADHHRKATNSKGTVGKASKQFTVDNAGPDIRSPSRPKRLRRRRHRDQGGHQRTPPRSTTAASSPSWRQSGDIGQPDAPLQRYLPRLLRRPLARHQLRVAPTVGSRRHALGNHGDVGEKRSSTTPSRG